MWWTTKLCYKHYTLTALHWEFHLISKQLKSSIPQTRNCFTDCKDPAGLTLQCRKDHNYEEQFQQDNPQSPHCFTLCALLIPLPQSSFFLTFLFQWFYPPRESSCLSRMLLRNTPGCHATGCHPRDGPWLQPLEYWPDLTIFQWEAIDFRSKVCINLQFSLSSSSA